MAKKYILFVSCIISFITSSFGQVSPRTYIAPKAKGAIYIDGKASEKAWESAPWSQKFIDIEGDKDPKYKTTLKMIWDEEYLYFFATLEEPHIWATLKQRDTVIFYNNDFEIFIDPDGDTHNYYEFEMNAYNTLWDLFLTKPYRNNGKVIDSWDIQGIQTAVDIEGTLNDATDEDNKWSVEIAMPWAVITEASANNQIPVNQFWRINFSRVNWDYDLTNGAYSRKKDPKTGSFLPEYNWVWSPQGVINMHEPEHWGYVYFSDADDVSSVDFVIPEDDFIKFYMYQLYRTYRSGLAKGKADKKLFKSKHQIKGKSIAVELQTFNHGWQILCKSPFTGQLLRITEDGKFSSLSD